MNTKTSFAKATFMCQLFAISWSDPTDVAPLIFNSDSEMVVIKDGQEVPYRIVSEFSEPATEDVLELKKEGLEYVDHNDKKYKCIDRNGKKYLQENNMEQS